MSEIEKTPEEELEEVEPLSTPREWIIGPPEDRRTFVQKQLSFHKKVKFFALLAQTVRQVTAVGGQGALSDLLQGESLMERGRQLGSADMTDAESFVNLASSLVMFADDFLLDAQCLFLNVPVGQQVWVKEMLDRDVSEGGLSDEEHVETIRLFVAQNWPAIKHFFGVLLPKVWKEVQTQQEKDRKKDEQKEEDAA